jgi:cobalt transport protein ATP-binding subunit
MGEAILKVEDLAYVYSNGVAALNGVSVNLYKGEKIAVMGSNGSGKSTFFLNINGVYKPQQGKITYRGTVVTRSNLKDLRKNIGIVFQDPDSQIIASTVKAEVAFGPMNLKLSKEEVLERVDEALQYMNITEFKERPPHYLSGGEKKRVAIADIIAMRSEIIVFDEPASSLDPVNAMMLEEVLDKLGAEGKTILISTHDVDFAFRWAERLLVFDQGRIIADGTPLEIFQNAAILKQANLKLPIMLEVHALLAAHDFLLNKNVYPKNIQELKGIIKNWRESEMAWVD